MKHLNKAKMKNATITIGKITLDVSYFYEKGQKGDQHNPSIPPSVEIQKVKFKDVEIIDLLNEIDCDSFYLKIETKILEDNEN